MGSIRGILLDGSVLLAPNDDENGNASLVPGADSLLRKLHYSKIPTGVSYELGLSAAQADLLERISRVYSLGCFVLHSSSIDDDLNNIALAWGVSRGTFLHVVSNYNKDLILKLCNCRWLIIILPTRKGVVALTIEEQPSGSVWQGSRNDFEGGTVDEHSSMHFVDKLEELPLTICHLNRKAEEGSVMVGYVMKPSREEDFAKRGSFPLCSTQNGLMFLPLTYELPLSSQLEQVDVVLHKATDDIIDVEISGSSENSCNVTFTRGMQELQRYIVHQQDCCVIDPFNNIYTVLDRLKIQQMLLGLGNFNTEGRLKIRGPHFLKVDNFKDSSLVQRLAESKLSLPSIVKPQVACGVATAHKMAIVFTNEDYKSVTVPLPAVVQEYVDHSATLFKIYVLGEKVFHAVKKSTPNAAALRKLSEIDGLKPLYFDSLKSLPIADENQHLGNHQLIDLQLVTDAAGWLRRKLDLTIFGFDVVVEEGSGDHVIVDVNYLPSFKEVPDDIAIPAFWEAIKRKFDQERLKRLRTCT